MKNEIEQELSDAVKQRCQWEIKSPSNIKLADISHQTSTPSVINTSNTNDDLVIREFKRFVSSDPVNGPAVSAIKALTWVIRNSEATTIMRLEIELKAATDSLKSYEKSLSVASSCELFNRYLTRTSLDIPDFEKCRAHIIARAVNFQQKSIVSRDEIAEMFAPFIRNNSVILIHGFSRVVIACCLYAAAKGYHFSVIVTEGRPDCAGYSTCEKLSAAGIPTTLILDSAIGYTMEKVNLVLMGAEGVVENGGIINKIGSYSLAMVAKSFRRPVYIVAESYKFLRLFPLLQENLPAGCVEQDDLTIPPFIEDDLLKDKIQVVNPRCDFTPPKFIKLLFTDLGILTPSAVSDELIKLYY